MVKPWASLEQRSNQGHHLNKLSSTWCCIPSFKVISLSVPAKKIFKGFYHILEWRPSRSCDLDHLNKPLFPLSKGGATWNLASMGLVVSKEKKFESIVSEWPCTKVNEWPWLLIVIYQLWHHRLQQFQKNPFFFTFFQYKSIRDQIWPCRKIDQSQPRVIIWTNLVVLEHPMLLYKFQDYQPFGSRKEGF